ncbi:myo-inositol-1(or 4)-monophosphatase [Sphingomonas kaistensis]|uniref:Myo-inositol-1(Or 4)-monophosphatase n=1 Tax=Sphingomonas kaistensis TaxID=298708 RepID=A0A7X6BEG9_9SPHN|nr:inositol monophosphatase family protein [Sphingomonas kaistensis]NJC04269.1 myo-inositol-1(or 4)-monophosphatase [Sphingomonas kaistensis]
MSEFLPFFRRLSAVARGVTLGAAVPDADNKAGAGGFDPVTELDRGAERALRAAIEAAFPEDGIEGEEYGLVRPEARRRWLLDPVDGTRALICGLPSWTTLVALLEDGDPVAGFIDAPALGELMIGLPGSTTLNGEAARVSGCLRLAEARLSSTDPYLFEGQEADAFERVRRAARLTRFGYDALAYARLAAGHLDLVIENKLHRHDWAALVPVVRGAGGVIGDWQGGSDFEPGSVVAAATPALFEQAVALLSR